MTPTQTPELKFRPAPELKMSRDRKVSPLSRWAPAARRWEPMVANSFGLAAGPEASCPGATEFCKGCYAMRTEKAFPSAGRLVAGNLSALRECGSNVSAMVELLRGVVDGFVAECEKVERKTGRTIPRVYRIHWDGDFYSRPYAAAWAALAREYPDVQFWLYTRSYGPVVDVIDLLAGIANVAVYLSVDAGNFEAARDVKAAHPSVKLAFCAETWEETEVLAGKFEGERRGPRCPELTGRMPMVDAEGVGACVTCGLCVWGRNNVRFAVKH